MLVLALSVLVGPNVLGFVDDARSFALEGAYPYIERGFILREDYWPGELAPGKKKIIRHQLFKGNEYWFWLATDADPDKKVVLSVHIYDARGELAEAETITFLQGSGARILPKNTGSYYIVVKVEKASARKVAWALVYAYR